MNEAVTPTDEAQRGLKLLTARNRKLHPRGQVQSLVRIAKRAIAKADWLEELAVRHPDTCPLDRAKVVALRRKANDAAQACVWLNAVHNLGYPV